MSSTQLIIPPLHTLRSRLIQEKLPFLVSGMGSEDDKGMPSNSVSADLRLEQLPYCMNASYHALIQLSLAQSEIVDRIAREKGLSGRYHRILQESERNPMAFEVDNFLDAARRAQNAIGTYISMTLKMSVPFSMGDFVHDFQVGKLVLSDKGLQEAIVNYWSSYGRTLKNYRDLSQHYAVVSSDGRVLSGPGGSQYIYLVLPNNPEVKNAQSLTYGKPIVHAFPYVLENFLALYSLVFHVSYLLLDHTKKSSFETVTLTFKDPIKSYEVFGHLTVSTQEIEERIDELQIQLKSGLPND